MDLAIVDVTDLPEEAVRAGGRVEFFGSSIDIDDFAARSGTIGYHLLTSLGPRYQRDYVGRRSSRPAGPMDTTAA
jgi:alanine racemase